MSLPSPISTEPRRASAEWRQDRARRAFRVRVAAVVAALAVLCGGLAVAAAVQGPRVQELRYDPAALIEAPGQTVLLSTSRPLGLDPGSLRIEPAADAVAEELLPSGVVVRFASALDAATRYRIEVEGEAGSLAAEIETPPLTVATLVHRDDGDRVVETVLGGAERILYQGVGVREFARLDADTVFVVEDDAAGVSRVGLHAVGGGPSEELRLPEPGRVERLGVVGTVALLMLTSADVDPLPELDRALFRVDLAGDHILYPVIGLDGLPVSAHDWFPIPGSLDVLIDAQGGQLLRYSPLADAPPLPLGQRSPVHGVVPDGSGVVVADAFGPLLLDLATGEETRIVASPVDGIEPFLGEVAVLPDGRRLAKVVVPLGGGYEPMLVVDDGTAGVRVAAVPEGAGIAELALSPSGQYAILVLDGGGPGEAVTGPVLVVDVDSGAEVAALPGVAPEW